MLKKHNQTGKNNTANTGGLVIYGSSPLSGKWALAPTSGMFHVLGVSGPSSISPISPVQIPKEIHLGLGRITTGQDLHHTS